MGCRRGGRRRRTGLIAICFILPAVISWAVCALMRKAGAIDEGDLKLED